jgi:hypothetical protein
VSPGATPAAATTAPAPSTTTAPATTTAATIVTLPPTPLLAVIRSWFAYRHLCLAGDDTFADEPDVIMVVR